MAPLVLEGRSTETGEPIRLTVDDGVIVALDHARALPDRAWLSPGWLDIQINGFEGHDPNAADADPGTTEAMVRAMWRSGVSGACVTLFTESEEHILHGLRAIADACDADPLIDAAVVGIHVEGPHISREDGPRGAHALRYIRLPDLAEFHRWQKAARGRIRIVTVSPEYDEAIAYIEALAAEGVIASIGHTAATSEQIAAAVDAGARWSTHLGNGAHASIRRHPNYVWDQLAEDRLSAGFIFDGQHLPPAVMKTVVRAKGIERTILVSDAVYVAGLGPGVYRQPDGAELELDEGGRLSLRGTPYLAGAVAALPVCVANAVRYAGVTLRDAVRMVTANPSRLLGLAPQGGHETLRVGAVANVTEFRVAPDGATIEPLRTVVSGHVVADAGA